MKPQKLMQSSKKRFSASLLKATAWARANPHEWDFSKIKAKERPMAVAWEYGRENFDLFLKFAPFLWSRDKKRYKKTKNPFHTIHAYGLGQNFLTFWESPQWPSKPFLDLSPQEKKAAFSEVFHSETGKYSSKSGKLVEDVTPYAPFKKKAWKGFHKNFEGEYAVWGDFDHPPRRVFLVNMGHSASAIMKSFKDHLIKAGLIQGRGRSTIEKDLYALTVHRLFKRFKTFKAMDSVLGTSHASNTSVLASENNRVAYWNYARGRLGKGWGRKGGRSKNAGPLFVFERVE